MMHRAGNESGKLLPSSSGVERPFINGVEELRKTPAKQTGWARRVLLTLWTASLKVSSGLSMGWKGRGKRPSGKNNFAPRTWCFLEAGKGGETRQAIYKWFKMHFFFSINKWLKCITLCQRPPEKHVMWISWRKERENPGAGVGDAEIQQVSGLERRKGWTHLEGTPPTYKGLQVPPVRAGEKGLFHVRPLQTAAPAIQCKLLLFPWSLHPLFLNAVCWCVFFSFSPHLKHLQLI